MTTDELIRQLRHWAKGQLNDGAAKAMTEAADRLEELDERIAIMAADMDNQWGKEY